jgi:hypothetical protein
MTSGVGNNSSYSFHARSIANEKLTTPGRRGGSCRGRDPRRRPGDCARPRRSGRPGLLRRSVRGNPSPYKRPETMEETAEMIAAAGGKAIPVRVDHTAESEVQSLFERVERDHGRLDVLVNSIAGEDPMMGPWASLWKADLTNGEAVLRQALLSHLITAKHAARSMIKKRRGLITEVTESDLLLASGNNLTQIVKLSQKSAGPNLGRGAPQAWRRHHRHYTWIPTESRII